MKVTENSVQKCIHEALDLDWCSCPDSVRAELNVTLPRPCAIELHNELGECRNNCGAIGFCLVLAGSMHA